MSQSDQKRPSPPKTLTIRRKPVAQEGSTTSEESVRRKASGARAHRVARLKVEKEKYDKPTESLDSPSNAPSSQASIRTATRTEGASRARPRDSQTGYSKRAGSDRPVGADRTEYRRNSRPTDTRKPERPVERATSLDTRTRTARAEESSAQPKRPMPARAASGPATRRDPWNPYSGEHQAFASCPRGLEEVLASELAGIGLQGVRSGRAGVHFSGQWHDIQKANLYSRLATRILVQVAQRPVASEDDIAKLSRQTSWESWFGPDHTLRVDTSAIHSPMKSLQFCNLLVKDGICDRLRDVEGARPSIDTVRPDARVHLFLSDTTATLYLDTSGESLFKRGWRLDKGLAPIRENLAAGLLALSGWRPGTPLLDPFCGSATILIEAAWMALDIAPGINRPFAFERLRHHDVDQWQSLRKEASERIRSTVDSPIVGFEMDETTMESARRNLARARIPEDVVTLLQGDATREPCPTSPGLILTNPPYGIRIEAEKDLMMRWASHLKQAFAGWRVGVISADLDLPSTMRLKPRRRTPVFNGALDCRLFMFDLVAGEYQR